MAASPTSAWAPGSVLAITKLHAPERRAGLVARGDLVNLLSADRHAKLALISAPPGAGKTTLLAEWSVSPDEDRSFAWLSLDPDDGDPARFWACVVAALRTVQEDFGERTLGALRGSHGRLVDVVVPLLINDASALQTDVVLILDDLHVIEDPAVHRSLAFLVDRLPPQLRIAVATRHDPPLPLARWRARGEVVDVRSRELRFSDREAAALLDSRFDVRLDPGQLARLQARTEGWAAGLQLAALSLRRGIGVEELLDAHGAADREVFDYLAGEVLDAQEPELRSFLLDTSILARMSGGVCDAVAGRTGSAAVLEELDRRNLLVVALDVERTWWRYHHLFAELLRRELKRSDPARPALLHRRAAEWHAEHGAPAEAIRHSLACGALERASVLIAEHWNDAFNRGELASVDAWLRALPASMVVADERLWLARLWTAMDRGELGEVRSLLGRAERAAIPAARAWAPVLHALHAFKRGDLEDARRHIVAADLATGEPFRRTTGRLVGGVVAFASGDLADAAAAFTEASDLAAQADNRLGLTYAAGHLALLAFEAGDDDVAVQELARADAVVEEDGAVGEHFVAYAAELARGLLAERSAAYEAADAALARATALARRGAGAPELASALVELGRLRWMRAARDDALRLGREARRVLDACPDPGRVAARLAELELRTEIRQAGPVEADRLSESELAVLRLLPTGLSNREIGDELFVSVNTVKTHLRNVYGKLHAGSREQAVVRARELGLIDA